MRGARRTLALALVAACCFGGLARAQQQVHEPKLAFDRGVEAFRRGDWQSARTRWLEALEIPGTSERARAALLYDLGNVAFREGNPVEAAGWYTACLRLAPRHADAWANLELAREKANVPPADRGDLLATVRRMLSAPSLAESEWLVLALSALLGIALAFEALRGGALARRLAVGAALACAVGLAPWIYNLREARRDPMFVIASEGAAVHSEPRADATVVDRLAPAVEVERRDELPGWVRVGGSGAASGWVESHSLLALRGPSRPETR